MYETVRRKRLKRFYHKNDLHYHGRRIIVVNNYLKYSLLIIRIYLILSLHYILTVRTLETYSFLLSMNDSKRQYW